MFITRCQQIFRIIAGLLLAMAFSAPAFAQNATDDGMSPTDITRMLQNEAASTSAEPEEDANVAEPKSILSHPALKDVYSSTTIDSPTVSAGDVPSDIVLLLDNSGSMKSNDPQFLTPKAVTEFINQLDYSTRLGIVIFDQKVTLAHPLTEVSEQSRSEMLSSLDKINYKGLYTNSPDGLERAIYELKLHAREDTERFIVFLTDGIVDTGNKQKDVAKLDWMRKELAADAADNNIRIFGIAFTDNADFQLIQSLAQQTSADYFRAYTPDQLSGVFTQIQDRITQAREAARLAEIEANKPPPPPPTVIVEAPKPVEPPKPIIVKLPDQSEGDKKTQYMLVGIAVLLIAVIAIILLRVRSSGQSSSAVTLDINAELVDMRGVTGQQSYPLDSPITQVGRIKGKEAEGVSYVVIPEKSISRHHAVIEYRNHAFWVMDQGSGNGTKLNNQLLQEEQRLKHGDIVTFDKFSFMYKEPDMEDSDATVVQASPNQARAFDVEDTQMMSADDDGTPATVLDKPAEAPKSQPAETKDTKAESDMVKELFEDFDTGLDETPADVPPAKPEPQPAKPEPQPAKPEPQPAKPEPQPAKPEPQPAKPEPQPEEPPALTQETRILPPEAAEAEESEAITQPEKKKDPVEEGLVEKTEKGFQPARTMTPDEFDRLFGDIDKDK